MNRICAVLDPEILSQLDTIPPVVQIAELRLDLLDPHLLQNERWMGEVVHLCASRFNTLIATFHAWADSKYPIVLIENALARAMEWGATTLDIAMERGSMHALRMIRFVNGLGKEHIVSLHVKQFPDSIDLLDGWIVQLEAFHPHWCKLAVPCDTKLQADAVMTLYERHDRLIAIPMGSGGSEYRRTLCFHGAPFTYAHCGHALAPGQSSVWDMVAAQSTIDLP